MRHPGDHRGRALVCLFILSGLTLVGAHEAQRRQELAASTTEQPRQTATNNVQETTPQADSSTNAQDASVTSTLTSGIPSSLSVTPSVPTETSSLNSSIFDDATLPPDELPLQPEITPGWAVAGAIMLVTGAIHALIGIKTKWLHTFLSTAFLASLGTATLIVYVMTPPVRNAIQGAYVVAVVCTGAVLGGLAIIFKEVTECLGGMLGGFCVSMWLLTLQPGGLVSSSGGRIVFIAAFTFSGFGIYFLPWVQVRTYGLIGCISFSGATVAVLGIDCFSRAGLKEFWAYIWRLNDELFPLGAVTYPLTRGIRVELAVTIIIFLAGIVSQLNLWRLINDRRSKREQEIAEGERNLRAEEEAIGRQIEENAARERRRWERVYGDNASNPENSADSSAGDIDSEKRVRASSATLVTATARTQSPAELDGNQMVEIPLDRLLHSSPNLEKHVIETVITSHLGDGDIPSPNGQADIPEQKTTEFKSEPEQLQKRGSTATFGTITAPPMAGFPVFSLPFQIPDAKTDEDGRSSFATFADFEDQEPTSTPQFRDSRAENMAKRLSSSSAKLLRSFSQRSAKIKRGIIEGGGESQEDLVIDSRRTTGDDVDSLVAVLDITDCLSSDDEDAVTVGPTKRQSTFSEKDVSKSESAGQEEAEDSTLHKSSPTQPPALESDQEKTDITTTPLDIPSELADLDAQHPSQSPPTSAIAQMLVLAEVSAEEKSEVESIGPEEAIEEKSNRRASLESVSAILKKGNLPPALSRVALSYRTNEWAKHISDADIPDFEDLQPLEVFKTIPDTVAEEPAPLDVVDLQQTAGNAQIPPAVVRPSSTMPNYVGNPSMSRSSSRNSLTGYPSEALAYGIQPGFSPELQQGRNKAPFRSTSMTGLMMKTRGSRLYPEPIAEEGDHGEQQPSHVSTPFPSENSWTAMPPMNDPSPVPHELSTSTSVPNLNSRPSALHVQQQQGRPTLIDMREMLLRTKASGAFAPQANSDHSPTPHGIPNPHPNSRRGSLEATSPNSYHRVSTTPILTDRSSSHSVDLDDIPLSQRRAIIRQSSSMSFSSAAKLHRTSVSSLTGASTPSHSPPPAQLQVHVATAESAGFNSHQPQRRSTAPTEKVRQAQLANFRKSVQADLISGASASALVRKMSIGGETNPKTGGLLGVSASISGLHKAYERSAGESRRVMMLGQKEAEAMKLEQERLEKERNQREFEERMRSGQLMEAHRDALRRIQKGVKNV
ncbi:hypothetical protein QBC43DRAFT_64696 [Cladorrhinum sp. PSN259]|nr:hypothetical protein QBC43DRAFT_64696 [Cladorrhinum sp. PSN259]